MSTTHTHDLHPHPGHDAATETTPRQASPWLWAALVAAALLAALWWLRQPGDSTPLTGTTPATQVLAPQTPAPLTTAAASTAPRATKRSTASASLNRETRALAGNAEPVYPPAALRAGVQGSVVARIKVDSRGNVSDVAIVQREGSRDRRLDRAVIDAARQWRFAPAMREGQAVASVVQVPVDFTTRQ